MKLTAPLIKTIADHVKHGISLRAAALASGAEIDDLRAQLAKGREDRAAGKSNLAVKLVKDLEKAEAEYEVTQQQLLVRHAAGFRRQDGEHQEGDLRAVKIMQEDMDRRRADAELARIRELTTY